MSKSTFGRYPVLANLLVKLFNAKFALENTECRPMLKTLNTEILAQLENVANLDDDRIIRRFLAIIQAIVRTNYFQQSSRWQQTNLISPLK